MNGNKTYILAAATVSLALLKIFTDIPEVESISILGMSEPDDLISAAFGIFAARSAVKKLES